jgi:hypothetical protein
MSDDLQQRQAGVWATTRTQAIEDPVAAPRPTDDGAYQNLVGDAEAVAGWCSRLWPPKPTCSAQMGSGWRQCWPPTNVAREILVLRGPKAGTAPLRGPLPKQGGLCTPLVTDSRILRQLCATASNSPTPLEAVAHEAVAFTREGEADRLQDVTPN